jgi:hypothetical protein
MTNIEKAVQFLFYNSNDGKIRVQVILGDETVWLTRKGMSEIFNTSVENIRQHIKNIYESSELDEDSTCKKILQVQKEGGRSVKRPIDFYNLDAIIAVGYRVNSYQATQFRIWATSVLKEYLIKGFALDDERLMQGKTLFGKDYFDELLERIREIRSSERRFYQKITDLYSTAIDYDKNSPITHEFYATVQNKLHWAIHNHTAAELVAERSDYENLNMGLTTWKNVKIGGKVMKSDVSVAKNYLTKGEISELNRVVTMYLDFAENMATRRKQMTMVEWVGRLDAFLSFNEYKILTDAGRISHKIAKQKAENEYIRFRIIQDKEFISDFDKMVGEIKSSGKLPKKTNTEGALIESNLSDHNKKLKKALDYNPKEKK